MQLIITEKKSVAESIAAVLSVPTKVSQNGFFAGSDCTITWCMGHLVTLAANPEVYDEKYKSFGIDYLPILPQNWIYQVYSDPAKKKQYKIVSDLMKSRDTSEIVCATDAGREGELIFRLVYDKCGCTKPIKRLWISSMEESAIRDGMNNLQPGENFYNLYLAAKCRQQADWLIGINGSRLLKGITNFDTISVGRVQTPTLAFIVEREKEIAHFVKKPYYVITLQAGEITAQSKKIEDIELAKIITSACGGKTAIVKSINNEEKSVSAPKLFDLTTLQRTANKKYGYTAAQTLELAQKLYEKKLLTYPRTDSRYLTTDMQDTVPLLLCAAEIVTGVKVQYNYVIPPLLNNKKVTDHHALMATETAGKTDLSALPDSELNILKLVAMQALMAAQPAHEYNETVIEIECEDNVFTAKGKTITSNGWKSLSTPEKEDTTLPSVEIGQAIANTVASMSEKFTTPPKHYTEDTLLSAMENASSDENAERKGLGTPATRASIIERLITTNLVIREESGKSKKSKTVYLLPSDKGKSLIDIVPVYLKSPELTAEWEHELDLIAKGKADNTAFMRQIEELTKKLIADNKDKRYNVMKREFVGKCPRCGNDVEIRDGKYKGYFCTDKECKFVLWAENRFFQSISGKGITKAIAEELLAHGKVIMKKLKSKKTGRTYSATVIMTDDPTQPHVDFRLEF